MELHGIGELLAERIVAYREENGPFATIDDLMNVEGIGEKKLKAITEWIKVGE
jgi:competence protein ComEA